MIQIKHCRGRLLTDIANPEAAKMAKKRCVRYECGDEDKCQEWGGPRWYSTCANACVCMSVEESIEKDVGWRTQRTDLP